MPTPDQFTFAAPGRPTERIEVGLADGAWKIDPTGGKGQGACDSFLSSKWFMFFIFVGLIVIAATVTLPLLHWQNII